MLFRSAGGVSFCLQQENARQYSETKIHPSWEEWRQNWYFAKAGSLSPHLLVPTAPAESLANSRDISSQDEALLPIIRRFMELRDSQVTGAMIIGDFVRRGIAPPQRRPQPLWETCQAIRPRVSPEMLKGMMPFLLPRERHDLPPGDFSLLDRSARGDATPPMPQCNAHGF